MARHRNATPTFRHYLDRLPPSSGASPAEAHRRIAGGREAEARLAASPPPTDREAQRLRRRARVGRRAADQLVLDNLGLVVAIARRYWFDSVPLDDLVQAGNVGLIRAVRRYDPDKGAGFTTWVAFGIRDAIVDHLARSQHVVALPRNVHDRHVRSLPIRTAWCGTAVTDRPDLRPVPLAGLRAGDTDTVDPIGEGEAPGLPIQDDEAPGSAEDAELAGEVRELLDILNERRHAIVVGRFGLDGADERGPVALAAERGVSREAIRLQFNAAMDQLRTEAGRRRLRALLDVGGGLDGAPDRGLDVGGGPDGLDGVPDRGPDDGPPPRLRTA